MPILMNMIILRDLFRYIIKIHMPNLVRIWWLQIISEDDIDQKALCAKYVNI